MERSWKRRTSDWTVGCSPCLALSHNVIQTWHFFLHWFQQLVCLSSAVKSRSGVCFSGTLSCWTFSLCWRALICCIFSSSFSCQVFTLMGSDLAVPLAVWAEHLLLSLSLSQPFLLLLVCLCRRRSFPPLFGSWVSREAGSLLPSVFSMSTQLLAIDIWYNPAAYSNVTANTTAIPCTVSGHTLTVLPGYLP